jgi:hypothetical protein
LVQVDQLKVTVEHQRFLGLAQQVVVAEGL